MGVARTANLVTWASWSEAANSHITLQCWCTDSARLTPPFHGPCNLVLCSTLMKEHHNNPGWGETTIKTCGRNFKHFLGEGWGGENRQNVMPVEKNPRKPYRIKIKFDLFLHCKSLCLIPSASLWPGCSILYRPHTLQTSSELKKHNQANSSHLWYTYIFFFLYKVTFRTTKVH